MILSTYFCHLNFFLSCSLPEYLSSERKDPGVSAELPGSQARAVDRQVTLAGKVSQPVNLSLLQQSSLTDELLLEILEVDVHVYLHGVQVLPVAELTLREGEVELSLRAVSVHGTQVLHEPPLHQLLAISGQEY